MSEAPIETYRGMDRAVLDVAYNNRAVVPDWQGYLDRWRARSDALYATRNVVRDLRYGDGPRQRLDLFASGHAHAPVVLFLHGGYWQWNDKEGQAFIAEGLLAHGLDVAIGEYSLAPAATMSAICAEALAMVRWLATRLRAERGREVPLFVNGISTGAHLMALTLGEPDVRGGLLISGIYDLEPIRLSSLNAPIGMDAAEARRWSPLHAIPARTAPVVLAHGAIERPEIRRQSADYAAALDSLGRTVTLLPVPGADHFSVLEQLAAPEGMLATTLRDMARG